MDRKKFLTQLGSAGVLTLIPLKQTFAASKAALRHARLAPKEKIMLRGDGKVLTVLGEIQNHKLSGVDTNNQMTEWVNEAPPGMGIPMHIHTKEDEIFRVLKGQVKITVGAKTIVLNPGDMAYAPKNIPHAWEIVGTETASMATSAFPAGMEHMFEELNALPAGPPDFERVTQICSDYGIQFV